MTGEDSDELALGEAKLVVEAAEDAFGGEGLVVLHEVGGEIVVGKGLLVEYFCEPAAAVAEESGLD